MFTTIGKKVKIEVNGGGESRQLLYTNNASKRKQNIFHLHRDLCESR